MSEVDPAKPQSSVKWKAEPDSTAIVNAFIWNAPSVRSRAPSGRNGRTVPAVWCISPVSHAVNTLRQSESTLSAGRMRPRKSTLRQRSSAVRHAEFCGVRRRGANSCSKRLCCTVARRLKTERWLAIFHELAHAASGTLRLQTTSPTQQ